MLRRPILPFALFLSSALLIAHGSATTFVTVKRGDTLSAIAARHGTSVQTLQRTNHLKSAHVRTGQRLKLPTARTAKPVTGQPATVTVQRGDTLTRIASRYGLTVQALKTRNNLRSDVIHIGQTLRLRAAAQGPARPASGKPVTMSKRVIAGVPVVIVRVDLRHPGVLVTPILPKNGLGSPGKLSRLSQQSGVTAVINGGYFHPTSYVPAGDLVVNGKYIAKGRVRTALAITADNRAKVYAHPKYSPASWRGYETVIANGPYVVRQGQIVVAPRAEGYRDGAVWGSAARSAIGVQNDRHVFFLSTPRKITLSKLASIMRSAGARDAIVLDGGSSTGIAYQGKTIVKPARAIAYGVAVYANYTGKRTIRH